MAVTRADSSDLRAVFNKVCNKALDMNVNYILHELDMLQVSYVACTGCSRPCALVACSIALLLLL